MILILLYTLAWISAEFHSIDYIMSQKRATIATLPRNRRLSIVADVSPTQIFLQSHALNNGFLTTAWSVNLAKNKNQEEVLLLASWTKAVYNSYLRSHAKVKKLIETNIIEQYSSEWASMISSMPVICVGGPRAFGFNKMDLFVRLESCQKFGLNRSRDETTLLIALVGVPAGSMNKKGIYDLLTWDVENRMFPIKPELVVFCRRDRRIPLEYFRIPPTPGLGPNALGVGNDRQLRTLIRLHAAENKPSLIRNYVNKAATSV